MNVRDYAGDVARAVGFLSRIPVPQRFFADHDGRMTRVAGAFPLAGVVIAIPPALAFWMLLALHADPMLAALIALAIQAVVTGLLHEDGLCDTADGLGGGRDREHALSIMRDSRIGTYGAAALIFSFGLRAAALAAIARGLPPAAAALCIPAAGALSRGGLVWHWFALPSARSDGVAAAAGKPDEAAVQVAIVSAGLLSAFLLWPAFPLPPVVAGLLVTAVCSQLATIQVRRRLSGHTGDTLGATQQICEIAALCTLAMAV
ncbi:adenosylcobinamide-GDP ribazoletransferase [Rhizobium sp. BK251]|uniref:adenosylcobinamide-GDP ribazoletransferase n=1 Tax=Rhizobium sp. BK251 TaxID=2512125 RepID=UPI00104ECD42|nr:adenosylcobinamide-GDP ribazoletransferase [Rhizobium sp. BK251]TCL75036.1 cobalamin-5'-phosphate synthase [Rhizobium sp. BK251]